MMKLGAINRRSVVWLSLGIVVTAAGLLLLPEGSARQIPSFALIFVWPALSWSVWMPGSSAERLVIGAGFGAAANILLSLLIAYLPAAPGGLVLAGVYAAVALAPLLVFAARGQTDRAAPGAGATGWQRWLLLVILAGSLFLRLSTLGYKELQGDEGVVMARAAAVLDGDPDALFVHEKGPVEILAPMAVWGTTGAINDFWARLPFTWAGWLSVAAVWFLARQWFGPRAALAAAALFAIAGLAIAFSRIVQYQAFVVFWGLLALLAASHYADRGRPRDLWLAALFLAASLLAHYDASLAAPTVLWLALKRTKTNGGPAWRAWLPAFGVGLAVLASFYWPFVTSPNFSQTLAYLVGDRIGTGGGRSPLGWSGPQVWQMLTFYNSLWYVLGTLLLLTIGLLHLLKRRAHAAAALYLLVPTLFYTVIVADPRTHVYTVAPGAAILAGLGVATVVGNIELLPWRRHTALGASSIGLLWLLLSTAYVLLMFVDWSSERQRTWSENRPVPWLFPTTWSAPPAYGLFGFPHQAGWRLVGDLLTADDLPYASNEEAEITDWYLAQAPRTHCPNFDGFILVSNAQDAVLYDPAWLDELHLHYRITVANRESMLIYLRRPAERATSLEALGASRWLRPQDLVPPKYSGRNRLDLVLGDKIELLGYDIESTTAAPGSRIVVNLYWRALTPIERNYQVFVHLYDDQMWAQDDGAPECDLNPTTRWEPGQIVSDPHILELPDDLPKGEIPIWVGMYDLLTEERLPVAGYPDGRVLLETLTIRPPSSGS